MAFALSFDLPPSLNNGEVVAAYQRLKSVHRTGELFGVSGARIHELLRAEGCDTTLGRKPFTQDEIAFIKDNYEAYASTFRLDELVAMMGRPKGNICRKAGELGLTNRSRPRDANERAAMAVRGKEWVTRLGHPRGMAGKKHTPAVKEIFRQNRVAMNEAESRDDKSDRIMRMLKTKVAKYGSLAPPRPGTSWKAGWLTVGRHHRYFRSRWEANYACYLEWLLQRGEIADWEHEPETFWFEKIKRGVRSYLPDFKVTETGGAVVYHEVKGWMDAASATKIKRMRIYHPKVKLIVIDKKAYEAIKRAASSLVPGWQL